MKKFARTLSWMLALCLAMTGMILPALGEGQAQAILDGKEYANVYKSYFSRSYPSLNYYATSYATVREFATNCIDSLVEPDIYGNYTGALAESWEASDDYKVWTFHLRKGQKWIDHTGAQTEYDMTAQDFVDGIRYIGDPLNGAYSLRVIRDLITGLSGYYWGLDAIDSGEDKETRREDLVARFDEMVGVKALDDYTVQYTLVNGAPYFLSLVESSMLLLPVEYDYMLAQGDDFAVDNTHMLYCGPYYVSAFERDKKIVLTKNPFYWDADCISVDTIEYQMIPDETTSLEMFIRGDINYTSVESEEYLSLQGGEWEKYLIPNEFSFSTNYLWLDFQGANPEFNTFVKNADFRKALRAAVDRESLASLREPTQPSRLVRNTVNAEGAIFNSEGTDYTQIAPLSDIANADWSADEGAARKYMEAAVAELCEADGTIKGVQAGTVDYLPVIKTEVDGKLPVSLIYVGMDDEDEIILAQLFEAMVEEAIGTDYIDVVLAFDTSGDFYETVGGSVHGPFNYDIYWDSLSTGYADPSGILTRITSKGVENVGAYSVPEYDELVEKALAAESFDERLAYFAQAEAWLLDNAYMIPVISSLRGYHMTYDIPHTTPRALYGSDRYKGIKVATTPVTAEEYRILDEAWKLQKNAQ